MTFQSRTPGAFPDSSFVPNTPETPIRPPRDTRDHPLHLNMQRRVSKDVDFDQSSLDEPVRNVRDDGEQLPGITQNTTQTAQRDHSPARSVIGSPLLDPLKESPGHEVDDPPEIPPKSYAFFAAHRDSTREHYDFTAFGKPGDGETRLELLAGPVSSLPANVLQETAYFYHVLVRMISVGADVHSEANSLFRKLNKEENNSRRLEVAREEDRNTIDTLAKSLDDANANAATLDALLKESRTETATAAQRHKFIVDGYVQNNAELTSRIHALENQLNTIRNSPEYGTRRHRSDAPAPFRPILQRGQPLPEDDTSARTHYRPHRERSRDRSQERAPLSYSERQQRSTRPEPSRQVPRESVRYSERPDVRHSDRRQEYDDRLRKPASRTGGRRGGSDPDDSDSPSRHSQQSRYRKDERRKGRYSRSPSPVAPRRDRTADTVQSAAHAFSNLRAKVKVPDAFNGERDPIRLERFVMQLQAYEAQCLQGETSQQKILFFISNCLRDIAFKIMNTLYNGKQLVGMNDFYMALNNEFGDPDVHAKQEAELEKMTMKESQTFDEFYAEFNYLRLQVGLPEIFCISKLRKKTLYRITSKAASSEFTTLNEIASTYRRIDLHNTMQNEENRTSRATARPDRPRKDTSVAVARASRPREDRYQKKDVVKKEYPSGCWHCGKAGHRREQCPDAHNGKPAVRLAQAGLTQVEEETGHVHDEQLLAQDDDEYDSFSSGEE